MFRWRSVPLCYSSYYFLAYQLVGLGRLITVSQPELEASVNSRIDAPTPSRDDPAPVCAALPHAAPS